MGKSLREFTSAKERRKYIEETEHVSLPHISRFSFDEDKVVGKNIENLIGSVQIPVGIAGPLKIQNLESRAQNCYIPLATTEGALVASISRGCKVVTESGGVTVFTETAGMTRGPVFYTGSLEKTRAFSLWMKENQLVLKEAAEATSSHLQFLKAEVKKMADCVFVRFVFDTKDAMGMNMATIATQQIVGLIEEKTGAQCIAVAGNYDIDKKPAWLNVINNRGRIVWAEARLKKDAVKAILKTSAQKIFSVWLNKCMLGSAMSGSMGFNAHYANIIAALFLATGQDPAHVVEGSLGITTVRLEGEDLYISVYLPSILTGTVGGGTALPAQQEALQLLGVAGSGNGEKFAEIIGGTVLAGELSLLASLAEGSLARAHKELGRGKR